MGKGRREATMKPSKTKKKGKKKSKPSPDVADGSPPSAEVVPNPFAHEYYHILLQAPELAHLFYQDSSKLGRPDAHGAMSSVTTTDEINEKIFSRGSVRAKIKTVDAQETLGGGVLVVVTGFLTREDNVKREFAQTLLIAPQDKGYYVFNDIFRFLEEVDRQQGHQGLANGTGAPHAREHDLYPEQEQHAPDQPVPLPVEVEEVNEWEFYNPSYDRKVLEEEEPIGEVIDEVPNSSQAVVVESEVVAAQEHMPEKSYASIVTDMTLGSTYHICEKDNSFQPYVGCNNRDHTKVFDDREVPIPSKSEQVEPGLQQNVLESLFNIPSSLQYEPNCMKWKKVVKKVESFGQGLEFCSPSTEDTQSNVRSDKEDDYQLFWSVSKKHWDMMRTYYQKARTAYSRGERAYASYLSEEGMFYRDLAREADEKASRNIFEARNKHIENMVTIDLHGQHVKQGIKILKLHLLSLTNLPSVQYLKVITGCGADAVGKGKLKRSVLDLLEKEGTAWSEENAGSLILCIDEPKEYSFTECDSEAE